MFKKEDEETEMLLRNFQEFGDDDALAELFLRYKPMVLRCIKSFTLKLNDQEDLMQEAYIICCTTARSYVFEATPVTYGCYFKSSLYNRMRSLKRMESAYKRYGNVNSVSMESVLEKCDLLVSDDLFGRIDDRIALEQAISNHPGKLTDLETDVLSDWLVTVSVGETADNLGISWQKAYNTLRRCKEKISIMMGI